MQVGLRDVSAGDARTNNLTICNAVLCIYGFCMVFTVNSDYFFEQHQPVVLIGEERRFL
jgi:hypothetical protein